MAGSFAASFSSSNRNPNIALPGDTVTFAFSSPPARATDVLVSVLESVRFTDPGQAAVRDRPIGGFRGRIENGVFQVERILGAPLPPEPDPVTIRLAADRNPASPHLFAHMPEPERVLDHTLRLKVEGKIGGATAVFEGTALLHVEYPLAMVVPAVPVPNDRSLEVVESWASQWLAHKPNFRQVRRARTLGLTRAIQPSDFDDLISHLAACAQFATSGVVALAVGHGDDGDSRGNSIPWCNLVPENFAPPSANPPRPFLYRLDIDQNVLAFGARPGNLPGGTDRVKLDAVDRMGDALAGARARRLILHTCRAGNSEDFMQLFADRLRIPLFAHTSEIEYTGAAGSGNILASYSGVTPIGPRDLRHWPVARLSRLFRPGRNVPPRFGP